VNQQDQQAIDGLFQHLYQATNQAGSRDAVAEALIQRYVQQAPQGLLYQMAQTLVAQQHTINQLRSQVGADQQGGAPAGFGAPQGGGYQGNQGYGQPQYQQGQNQPGYQPANWQQRLGGGGFLAGAGKLALGIGGGILGAEVLTNIFDGVGGLFDGDRDRQFDQGYQDGFAGGDNYGDQGGFDNGGFDNGGFDNGNFDDSGFDGGFDNGSF
jgi:hypothetical protein